MSRTSRTVAIAAAAATALTAAALALTAAPAHADEWGDCQPTARGYTCHTLREASIGTCIREGGKVPDGITLDGIRGGETYRCAGGQHNGVKLDPDELKALVENPESVYNMWQLLNKPIGIG
ncbi:hypothetical protein HCN51_57365 [Nonomuraea sp. FMUSA5-5]|uniref:Secreted protein n=1 Tax=Nonomuraea composti TaxID=2720023 RepID=A0ABX1BRN0_9ACTN|nr:hypothetical protein [Nonomuraea sp. FMUSA5-5]NJP98892.1 hypothetical protein [Nonomuraea sp. FMUSA5-5]